MKPLTLLAPALLLGLLSALPGCPKRSDSGSTTDAGATPVAEAPGRAVQCLALDRKGDLLIGISRNDVPTKEGLVVLEGYGVYRLGKGAATSTQIASGLPQANVRALVVTPAGTLLAATVQGLFRSADDGASWAAADAGPVPTAYGLLQARSGKLFAATNRGLLVSSDDGKSWAAVGENRGEVNAIVEHPTMGFFAGTDKGVIHSATGDNPWEPVGLAKETVLTLAIDAKGDLLAGSTASDIAAGGTNPGIALMDQMIGWKAGVLRYTPPPPAPAASSAPAKAAAKPPSPTRKKSDKTADAADAGEADASDPSEADAELDARWKPAGLQNNTVWAIAALPDGSVLAATHTRGLQRLDAATSKWAATNGIATDNPVATILVAGDAVYAGAVRGLFRSTDQGRTFRRASQD